LSYLFIPGIAWVRAPSRWIYFAGLPLALLAGRGLQECVQNASMIFNQVNVARLKNILMVLLGFSLFCFAVYVLIVDASNASSLFQTFLLTWIFVAAFLILISLLALSKVSPQAFAVMMILLAWFDLATHYRFMELQPGPGGHPVDREVRFIHRADWNHRVKVFFDGGGNRSLYHGSAQRFRELDGGSPLTPEIHWQLREDTSFTAFKKPNMTLLNLCGTGIVLTDMVDKFPPPWERETDRMFIKPSPAKRACFYAERFGAEPEVQRQLLHLQSLPFDRVLFASSKQDEAAPSLDPGQPLFPKPFLLASCSGNALDPSAHLIVDGKDYFEEFHEDAGYILALADADRGRIETVKRFDLNQDYDAELRRVKSPPTENLRMQQFLASIPEGKYVLGAVNDNATNMVLEETLFAFRSVGACIDIRKQFRLAHAFIGRKGDPVGSAFEIVSPTEAYVLRTKQSVFSHGNTRGQLVLSNVSRRPNREREPFPPQLKDTRYPNLALEIEGVSREMEIRLREPLAVYSSPFRLSDQSRGQAAIEIGGKDYAKNRRGYNIVVYDPATQTVVGSEVFDLIADYDAERGQVKNPPVENLRMQAFLQNVADGHVILGAIKEEAIDLLSESTLRVLQQLGSSMRFMVDPEQRKRLSHAFFTVKGTGSFVEELAKETDAVLFTRIQGAPDYAGEDRVETASFQSDFTPLSELRDSQERLGHPSLQPAKKMAVIDRGPNRLSISGVFPEEGWLFSNEIFFPGWKVYIDDAEGDIERVNYYFRGVPVPKGAHEITMQYSPKAFQAGILLSAISFVLWAVVIIVFLFLAKPVSKTEGESAKS
ncbi:YfhO family protein, partial [bacterium]|nr:YfhO family protein [bacterium]